ncbi:MAG TPA: hypothetical protein VGC41_28485 [Kofleriaceae bacterium]
MAVLLLLFGCDAGNAPPPAKPPPVATPAQTVIDAAPLALFGTTPATLGPAFAGLALGQTIDQAAAEAWLQAHGITAHPFVRAGRLVSISIPTREFPWRNGEHWFDPASHQYATREDTEQGSYLQLDLAVSLDDWLTVIVDPALVTTDLEDAEKRPGPRTMANSVDGRSHVSWVDSAVETAATATEISVVQTQQYKRTRRTSEGTWEMEPGAISYGLEVRFDAPLEIYQQIAARFTTKYGKPVKDTWHKKLTLRHEPAAPGFEHIELFWDR